MKTLGALIFVGFVCYIQSEPCRRVSDCTRTRCSSTALAGGHVHMECKDGECTCTKDMKPCVTISDCEQVRCISDFGLTTNWHCLDGNCTCLKV